MSDSDLARLVQHHDGQLEGLNARVGHVEKTLNGHGMMLQDIKDAVTKQDARPTFDFHQTVSTVTTLAVLFSMVVGGIIYIVTQQNSTFVQTVNANSQDLGKIKDDVDSLKQKFGWVARTEKDVP